MYRFLVALAFAGACSSAPAVVNARPVAAIAHGDCAEARRRADLEPDLDVDRLPAPVRQSPRPLRNVPAAVRARIDTSGAVIKVNVVIDTSGRADMKTFTIVESSHPWLAANLRSVLPRWRFTPAELAGCKVARVYKFSATAPPRVKRAASAQGAKD